MFSSCNFFFSLFFFYTQEMYTIHIFVKENICGTRAVIKRYNVIFRQCVMMLLKQTAMSNYSYCSYSLLALMY